MLENLYSHINLLHQWVTFGSSLRCCIKEMKEERREETRDALILKGHGPFHYTFLLASGAELFEIGCERSVEKGAVWCGVLVRREAR